MTPAALAEYDFKIKKHACNWFGSNARRKKVLRDKRERRHKQQQRGKQKDRETEGESDSWVVLVNVGTSSSQYDGPQQEISDQG